MFPAFNPIQANTPDAVARQRAIANALIGKSQAGASNVGQGIASIAQALSGTVLGGRADEADAAGQASVAQALAGLGPSSNFSDISGALANPWLTSSPGASTIASALLQRNLDASDPLKQLQLQTAQLELERLQNPQSAIEYRPLSAEERALWGIPATDTTPYAIGLDGLPKPIGGGGQTINVGSDVGTIPPGFELFTDPATGAKRLQPIAGGPAAMEASAAADAAAAGDAQTERYGSVVTEDIGRALTEIEKDPTFTTGVLGQTLSQIGGTPANRVKNLIETVKSNVGFDRLQAMRESSPTGGALGSVTERELSLLTSAIGSLEQSNNSEDLAYNLRRVNKIYMDIIHGPGKWEDKVKEAPAQGDSNVMDWTEFDW